MGSFANSILLASLNTKLPPVLEDSDDTLKKILSDIDELSIHQLPMSKCIIPRHHDLESCFAFLPSYPSTSLEVEHDPVTGELLGFNEVSIAKSSVKSSKNSTSMRRQPGHLSEGIRGNTSNFPFLPGGFDDVDVSKLLREAPSSNEINFKDLLTHPPGMSGGVNFKDEDCDWLLTGQSALETISLNDLMDMELMDFKGNDEKKPENDVQSQMSQLFEIPALSDIIKLEHRVEQPRDDYIHNSYTSTVGGTNDDNNEFVCVIDVQQPVKNFKKLLPSPATEFPFELDTFQKQAILRMENNDNVFVAAHTSAGKTVVAEYAIALSMRHLTKAIYTSPIKALSNQKFREFRQKFEDVGLVTGDVQINQEANMLIMTTEILRSMLYNGSDVIRDLEWVVFDEVHYINDAERGVVWEEVLILLPAHVKIVMLSATVPNTREFAEWVGRIKRKKVYVISTPRRPVPLEHFLYTGNNTKTAKELFLILNAKKEFIMQGHKMALEAKAARASKHDQSFGPRRGGFFENQKHELQVWTSLILELDKQKKTPAVAFVFSKKRIDVNTHNMTNVDLLTSSEKNSVTTFFNQSMKVLKAPDRELPQVRNLMGLLKRGIGVHHSGVLPVLKEIVEMLFQRGLVKVLFATETFAMGVNMPARTVIFDSIEKHDGERMRTLLPGEYIQMAGRAGRRGLDSTGMVIILCKSSVPDVTDLHRMMMGIPMLLRSQFRVTYSMVLNLMRVEQVRIEDMMRRSFGEFDSEKSSDAREARLAGLIEELKRMQEHEQETAFQDMEMNLPSISEYYDYCDEYYKTKEDMHGIIFKQYHSAKFVFPGRVVVLRKFWGVDDVLGVVLAPVPGKDKTYKVLVNANGLDLTAPKEKHLNPRSYVGVRVHKNLGSITPKVTESSFSDFSLVVAKVLKLNADKILDETKKDNKRKDDAPKDCAVGALQELIRFVDQTGADLPEVDPVNDLRVADSQVFTMRERLRFIQSEVKERFRFTHDRAFDEKFERYRKRKEVEEEIASIQFKLSDQGLTLLPEYQQRVQVLRRLSHVDDQNRVKLKGKVACEIKTQEILLTEVIFDNLLGDLEPEVIAAILSVVVFEQKRCSEPKLNPKLVQVKEKFSRLADYITEVQREFRLEDDVLEQCNFGLMEVVHEWARGVPFAKLTELTDVQEGVIVRCIQRLDEVFRDVGKAARIVGDPALGKKMEETSRLVRRDIVFTASLYLQ